MTTIDLTKTPDEPDEPARKPVGELQPLLPAWMRDRAQLLDTTRKTTQRGVHRATWHLLRLPLYVARLLLMSPRGLWRVVKVIYGILSDGQGHQLRVEAATGSDSQTWLKLRQERNERIHRRMIVAGCLGGPVALFVLAAMAPTVFAWALGLVVFLWIFRQLGDLTGFGIALAAGGALGWILPGVMPVLPLPSPGVMWWGVFLALLGLGWVGRTIGKPLGGGKEYATPSELVKPTAEMVVDALCRSGIPGMTLQTVERVHEETRIIAPGVAATPHGYLIELELPPGVTVEMVVKQRAPLAAALRRDLSTVWPSGNPERHPGYLRLFLSYQPMTKAKQPAWPVATGTPLSYFEPIPMFTDEQQRWVEITLAGTHMAMGGASGSGKSVGLRQFGVALAFALDTRIIVFDGKLSGDLNPIRDLCHGFYEGAEPEDVAEQIACLKWLVAERQRRARFLSSLPREENRQSRVTAELARKYPKQLAPIVVLFDEVQEYTEYGVKGNTAEMAVRAEFVALLTKLSRLARSAGISLVFVSQKPDATVLPSAIMGNCGIRVAFRVLEQVHNDQILGTSARKNGVDATMFTLQDRGVAWVRGGESADTMVARTWSAMVEMDVADELAAKAYAMRKAAGLLTGQAAGDDGGDEDEVVYDLVQDTAQAMQSRGRGKAQWGELVDWLRELRGQYVGLAEEELSAGIRSAGVRVRDVRSGDFVRKGVYLSDLRKQDDDDAA